MARFLLTSSTIVHGCGAHAALQTRQDLISKDRITIRILFHGSGKIGAATFETPVHAGLGHYTCSRLCHTVTYDDLCDVLVVSIPVHRLSDLVGPLRARPAAPFTGTDVELGAYAFLNRVLFRRLTADTDELAHAGDAENAVLSIVRAMLIPLLREEHESPDPEIRRIVDSEIEAHHRDPALTVDSLAAFVGISRRQLYRATGAGIAAALDRRRARTARETIEADPSLRLSVVAELSGFTNTTRLRDNFMRAYGVLPSAFRGSARQHESVDNAL